MRPSTLVNWKAVLGMHRSFDAKRRGPSGAALGPSPSRRARRRPTLLAPIHATRLAKRGLLRLLLVSLGRRSIRSLEPRRSVAIVRHDADVIIRPCRKVHDQCAASGRPDRDITIVSEITVLVAGIAA